MRYSIIIPVYNRPDEVAELLSSLQRQRFKDFEVLVVEDGSERTCREVVEAVEEEYGLNDPLIEQYLSYMGNLLKGDLGISYQDPGTSVEEIIGRAAPLTVSLGLSALIV
mgnify:CR=1 FL=1